MSWEWLALTGVAVLVVLLIVFRNTTFVKQNWKYALILIPFVALIVIRLVSGAKGKGSAASSSTGQGDDLGKAVEELKDKLQEAQMETAVEISAAKTKNEEVVKQLEEVKKIEDKTERRKRLASLMG